VQAYCQPYVFVYTNNMTQKKAKQIDLVSGNGVRLRIAYKGGRVLLRYVDLSLFLKSVNVDYELVNTMEKKTDGKRFTP
jgi:hypothetical protein